MNQVSRRVWQRRIMVGLAVIGTGLWCDHASAGVPLDVALKSAEVIHNGVTYKTEITLTADTATGNTYFARMKVFAKTGTGAFERLHTDAQYGQYFEAKLLTGTQASPDVVQISGQFDLVAVSGAPAGSRDKVPVEGVILMSDPDGAGPMPAAPRLVGKTVRGTVMEWKNQKDAASSGTGGPMPGTPTGPVTAPVTTAYDPCSEDPDDLPLYTVP